MKIQIAKHGAIISKSFTAPDGTQRLIDVYVSINTLLEFLIEQNYERP